MDHDGVWEQSQLNRLKYHKFLRLWWREKMERIRSKWETRLSWRKGEGGEGGGGGGVGGDTWLQASDILIVKGE